MAEASPASDTRPPEFSVRYTRYALGLLVTVYVVNFVDRQILAILLEAIREDLGLSDTQLGLLSGIAFAALYSTLGIPIARWADRGVRRSIIALALFVWSAMTGLQGAARSFTWLMLARVGVGVGEAGCSPPAHSMLSDLFPPSRRATALAIYSLGIPIGSAIGYIAGGWIREIFGWRAAFVAVGLPGILLALLVRLTLREPTRGYWDAAEAARERPESIREVARFLLQLPSFLHLAIAGALHAFYGYGAGAFNPAFLERVHGLSAAQVGTGLGLIAAGAGGLGTFLGGYLSDRLSRLDERWSMWLPGAATALGVPLVALFYLYPDPIGALVLATLPALVGGMYLGPTFAVTQSLVPARMRAQAAAVLLLILNLIGLGLGPSFVGALSDWLAPVHGEESIRYALLGTVMVGAAWSTVHYVLAARTLRADLRRKNAL
jgi:predicted MFS family arabinose efflux permease